MVYSRLAPIYDRVMAHVNYDDWAVLFRKVIKKYLGVSRPSVLEIGGGTAKLASRLPGGDIDYWGSDLSFAMCTFARLRGYRYCTADGRALPFKKLFNIAIFLYDGINYLMCLEDYTRLFREVHGVLEEQGLFLFDITTYTNSITFFEDTVDQEHYDDLYYSRHSYFNGKKRTQHNDFLIFNRINGSTYEKHEEKHVQKVFSVEDICTAIPGSLFEIVGVWDSFSFRRYHHDSLRVHFLLRKQPS
ncbi:MAG: methyltransferase domain-containing protein [Chitinivibrionales bacterium]|nr:methyltransferase domain-containing protein [Chitinivibrionales bacterium]